jgi:hypothetical protein
LSTSSSVAYASFFTCGGPHGGVSAVSPSLAEACASAGSCHAAHRISVEGRVRGAKGRVGRRQHKGRAPLCSSDWPGSEQQGRGCDGDGGEHFSEVLAPVSSSPKNLSILYKYIYKRIYIYTGPFFLPPFVKHRPRDGSAPPRPSSADWAPPWHTPDSDVSSGRIGGRVGYPRGADGATGDSCRACSGVYI